MKEESAAEILRVLNDVSEAFRSTMTEEERAALDAKHSNDPESAAFAAGTREEAMTEFTADALQTLADDIHSVIDGRMERLYRQALDVYYAAEELARDPEHAYLAEQAEAMRRAHISEYGYPPPPRS
jgi:aminopeptidase N